MAKTGARKNVSVSKMLGGLSQKQAQELAAVYNDGLGSGMSPEEWKRAQAKKSTGKPAKKGK